MTKAQTNQDKVTLHKLCLNGDGGAPIPEPLRKLSRELDGRTLALEEAINRINLAANHRHGSIFLGEDCILYSLESATAGRAASNSWVLFGYRPCYEGKY